ncbi:hypothetical protein GCM10025298_31160 [Natronobiforma cellulositropha]
MGIAPLEAPHWDDRNENLLESGGGKLMGRSLDDCKTTQLNAVWQFTGAVQTKDPFQRHIAATNPYTNVKIDYISNPC